MFRWFVAICLLFAAITTADAAKKKRKRSSRTKAKTEATNTPTVTPKGNKEKTDKAKAIHGVEKTSEESAPKSDVAIVAIIRYDDKTGTENFGYMPDSLREAIGKALHSRFEFIDADAAQIEQIVAQVRSQNAGKLTAQEAAEICRLADIDILIFGNFIFDKNKNAIEIRTNISLNASDVSRNPQPIENKVDATIFQAADKVAADIVTEIAQVAREQQQAKGKTVVETDEKIQLEKIVAPNPEMDAYRQIQARDAVTVQDLADLLLMYRGEFTKHATPAARLERCRELKLIKNQTAESLLERGTLAYAIMKSYTPETGWLFWITGWERYALRDVQEAGIMPNRHTPAQNLSGEQLLGTITAAEEYTVSRIKWSGK
ncbi:MAG: hypothetical protein JSR44_10940 [Spirochaetes bacterium]|nr:hypothetical protein [Spirochaetota bacterium]